MNSCSKDYFSILPLDVQYEVLARMDIKTLIVLACVNKYQESLVNNFWKQKFNQHFPHLVNQQAKDSSKVIWCKEYIKACDEEYKYLFEKEKNLFQLIKDGDIDKLKKLSNFSLKDLNIMDGNGVTLLEWAKQHKNNKSVLMNYFYSLSEKNIKSALLYDQSIEIIKELKSHKPWSKEEAIEFLRLAAKEGYVSLIEFFIQQLYAKQDINVPSKHSGATILMFAVERGHKDVVDILLRHDADMKIALSANDEYHLQYKVNKHDAPIHAAIKNNRKDIVESLINKDKSQIEFCAASSNTPLMIATRAGNLEMIEFLLQQGANVNAQSSCGATALLFAVENGRKEVVKKLLDHGADLNIPLHQTGDYHAYFKAVAGDTPLHIAVKNKRQDIIYLLVNKNANLNIVNSQQKTPKQLAKGQLKTYFKLLRYIEKREHEAEYLKSFRIFGKDFFAQSYTLFGHTFNISKTEKLKAARNLKAYVEGGATLLSNSSALKNGRLEKITKQLKIKGGQ